MRTPHQRLNPSLEAAAPGHASAATWLPEAVLPPVPSRQRAYAAGSKSPKTARHRLHPCSTQFAHPRCTVKGCVFPAGPRTSGRCLQHHRQQHEPTLFHSQQPTLLLLERAKFELPPGESQDHRRADRRRMAALRETFLLEDAA